MSAHVFIRDHQPATRYVVDFGTFKVIDELAIREYIPARHWFRKKPQALVWTHCCDQRRIAKNCTTQVYYDTQPFWCRQGKGCKS